MERLRAARRLFHYSSSKSLFGPRSNPTSAEHQLSCPASGNALSHNYPFDSSFIQLFDAILFRVLYLCPGFETGVWYWCPYIADQKGRFGGIFWGLTVGTGLGKTSRIQNRHFGSLAATIQRNPSFSTLNADDVSYFKGVLDEKNVIQDEEWLLSANADWMRKYNGSSKLLLQPRSTEEVLLSFSWHCFLIFSSMLLKNDF